MEIIPLARRRKLRTWSHGKGPSELKVHRRSGKAISLLDLASNDYLGLSRHPDVIEAARTSIDADGVGAGASPLVTGHRPIHQELEEALADWLSQESVLLFPSGFQANLAAVIAITDRHTTVLADRLIHHSLLLGVKASGAKLKRFAHNDLNDLEKHLKICRNHQTNKSPLVLTESLFSMEGTSPAIKEIAELCDKYGAQLIVDEAHSLGTMGIQGKGLCYELAVQTTILSGTFGKAFGSGGAFLAGSKKLKEQLLQTSGAFKYSTALAPPLAAAALASLKLIKKNPTWGEKLQQRAEKWRSRLSIEGWSRPLGNGPILPLIIGSDEKTLFYQHQLEKSGLLSVAIRPPTVPERTSRLRIALRQNLPKGTLKRLINALKAQ
ncbi:8-amino-7-oxononanoate synthase [Prochlorococcus sp. MIT 1307]|uniref:aminotransferase class I/II-fold pyridoxal phosphate-dependent enzyme n=1 Tax=Prochlorococcus sp. MIT 1307 TaxID=3096219 RepID=UPI002A74AF13|nr:8-amino-7-oxononanoate synthase [Prochlorococcus sp. MIT 1307]